MDTYTYAYKTDSKKEVIGRVLSEDLLQAQIKIAMKKKLSIESTKQLFEITKTVKNEKNVRSY